MRETVLLVCFLVMGLALILAAVQIIQMAIWDWRMDPKRILKDVATYEYSTDDDGNTVKIPVNRAGLTCLTDKELMRAARYRHQIEQVEQSRSA